MKNKEINLKHLEKRTLAIRIFASFVLLAIAVGLFFLGKSNKVEAIPPIAFTISGIVFIVFGLSLLIFSIVKYNSSKKVKVISRNKKKMKYLEPIPALFTDKFKDNFDFDVFKKEFALTSYKLPKDFKDFASFKNLEKWYKVNESGLLDITPIEYERIEELADSLLIESFAFDIPPHCIPFAQDESDHVTYVLDYNLCGKQGEPRVLAIDSELIEYDDCDIDEIGDDKIENYYFNEKVIANTFAEFLDKIEERKYKM